MKKGDAKAIGQATASILFLLTAGIGFKFFVLSWMHKLDNSFIVRQNLFLNPLS